MKYNTKANIAYIKANVPKDRLEQFEVEIRADERKKMAEELLSNFECNKKCTDFYHNCQFAITGYTVEVDEPSRCLGCKIKNRIMEVANGNKEEQ